MLSGRFLWGKSSRFFWPLAALALVGLFALAASLRRADFSSEFILFSYLQIVGTLLAFTFAANALVRFRGTRDRFTLILALGFALTGLVETFAVFGPYGQVAVGAPSSQVPVIWMVSRTLLATLLLGALIAERYLPHSREPGREAAVALLLVGLVTYLTSALYLGAPVELAIQPSAWFARPWDLLPAAIFLLGVVRLGRRSSPVAPISDRALYAALWLNVACHVVITQSVEMFDAPFTLAQCLKVTSYAVVLTGGLLENARLFDQVRRLAVSDSLTGLGNYRTLIHTLESEIQRSQRSGRPFAVLLLDLDGLKQINDRYGHLVGSRAICRLGNVLRANCRIMDTAARYGGDEFAIVLPEATAEAAHSVGQRIQERLLADPEEPRLSVSVGAASFPEDGSTIDELLDAADIALYGMKGLSHARPRLSRAEAFL